MTDQQARAAFEAWWKTQACGGPIEKVLYAAFLAGRASAPALALCIATLRARCGHE